MAESSQPIRILNVIARLNVGGTAMHVVLLTAGLNQPNWHSRLVCGQVGATEGDMTYVGEKYAVKPLLVETLGRELHPIRDLRTLLDLIRLFRRERPHIVHTHTAKAGFVGRVAARLAGVPIVVHTFHGHVFNGYFGPRKTQLFLALERFAARLSDRILTVSERVKNELADEYQVCPKNKIDVVPLGLDLTTIANTPRHQGDFREQWRISDKAPLVGLVGRMVPIKRHDILLNAVAKARTTVPDMRVALVGDGELRPAIETQIDTLGLHDAVTITGWVRDLAPIYSDLDLLIMCSDNEGTPVSAIEALAAGVPVIGTSVGGLPDLLKDSEYGTLVPRGDTDALAQAMVTQLATPKVAPAIRAEVVDAYSMKHLAECMTVIYKPLLEQKGFRV